jgi:hypothetical protein
VCICTQSHKTIFDRVDVRSQILSQKEKTFPTVNNKPIK